MWLSVQIHSIFIQSQITADSLLDRGDTELAKKTQPVLSWSLRRQKINVSGGEECLFQLTFTG